MAFLPPSSSGARDLGRDRRTAVTLEFAIVAVPCLGLLLGLFGVSYDFYLQEVLDYSLQTATRQIQIGQVPSTYSATDFTSKIFCSTLGLFADCGAVLITVQPVSDFQNAAVVTQPSPTLRAHRAASPRPGGMTAGLVRELARVAGGPRSTKMSTMSTP